MLMMTVQNDNIRADLIGVYGLSLGNRSHPNSNNGFWLYVVGICKQDD